MIISYSQLKTYRTCPYRYYLQYIKGIIPEETEALRFGKKFHESIFEIEEKDEQIKRMQTALWNNKEFQKYIDKDIMLEVSDVKKIGKYNYYIRHDGTANNTILEFKSAKKEWTEDDFKNLIQPHLAMKIRGGKFIYFIITKHKKPRVQVKKMEFDSEAWKNIKKDSESMMKDFLYTKNRDKHCYFCPFKKHCEAWF